MSTVLAGGESRPFSLERGVKQGDPSAMQLFILAYDPIIRFIAASLGPEYSLFAYCDDVAVACPAMIRAWPTISKCF